MPWELSEVIGTDIARAGLRRLNTVQLIDSVLQDGPTRPYSKVAVLESSMYMRNQLLRDTDWASMAHSLEVRVPLVDAYLLSQMAIVSANSEFVSKRLLAFAPTVPLPAKVVDRPKTGFQTPIHSWLQRDKRVQQWRQIPALSREQGVSDRDRRPPEASWVA